MLLILLKDQVFGLFLFKMQKNRGNREGENEKNQVLRTICAKCTDVEKMHPKLCNLRRSKRVKNGCGCNQIEKSR